MALPKRNRGTIKVRDCTYHWVKGARGDNGRGVATIQHSTGCGARLMIDPYGTITGEVIPYAIEFALDHGWNPLNSGEPFLIAYSWLLEPPACFALRSKNEPPFWNDPRRKAIECDIRDRYYKKFVSEIELEGRLPLCPKSKCRAQG